MEKKKLYICITPFFPTPDCFRGPFIYDQVRAIERNSDFQVIVFMPTPALNPESDYEYEGVKVYRFKTLEMPSMVFNGITNGYNARNFIKKVNELGISYDNIVIAHGHTAMFSVYALALKKHNPSIISIVQHHDPDPFGLRNGRLISWRPNAYYKMHVAMKLFKQIDIHLCVSQYVEHNLKLFPQHSSYDIETKYLSVLSKLQGFKSFVPKKAIVLYNGVDTKLFFHNPQPHNVFTIGCIGNMGDWKDQLTLIKAVKKLCYEGVSDLKVILIGSGSKEKQYRKFIEENNLSNIIEIRKEVQHKELPIIFNSFDLFVLPSYFEGFGCVFTEAAACGVPFICCKGQGASEYIAPEEINKWTIEPFDYIDLADKIIKYKKKRTTQKYVEIFDIDYLINNYLKQLNAIITANQ